MLKPAVNVRAWLIELRSTPAPVLLEPLIEFRVHTGVVR